MIDYNTYPALLFTSFDKDNATETLPFNVVDEQTRVQLSHTEGFKDMFSFIAAKNSLMGSNSNTNYHLNDKMFENIDGNDWFRNDYYKDFSSRDIKSCNGIIMFDKGYYVYTFLSESETKGLKNEDGRYLSVALFCKNTLVGFEEGVIDGKWVTVEDGGIYPNAISKGTYLSFAMITLSYAESVPKIKMEGLNVKETIYQLHQPRTEEKRKCVDTDVKFKPLVQIGHNGNYNVLDIFGKQIEVENEDSPIHNRFKGVVPSENKADGWRLPDVDELRIIYKARYEFIGEKFVQFVNDNYWSQSSMDAKTTLSIDFDGGFEDVDADDTIHRIRLVRDKYKNL